MFDQQARTRLRNKLDYERWVLTELEEEHDVFPDRLGDTVIKNGGITAKENGETTAISQPRVDEVIQRLYPLVFASKLQVSRYDYRVDFGGEYRDAEPPVGLQI